MTDPHDPADPAPGAGAPGAAPPASPESRRERIATEHARVVRRSSARGNVSTRAGRARRALDSVMRAFEPDVAAGGGVLAGAVAFRFFLFMVPYVFLLVGVPRHRRRPPTPRGSLAASGGDRRAGGEGAGERRDLSFHRTSALSSWSGFATVPRHARAAEGPAHRPRADLAHTRRQAGRPSGAALWLIGFMTLALALSAALGELRSKSFLIGLIATLVYRGDPGLPVAPSCVAPAPRRRAVDRPAPGRGVLRRGPRGAAPRHRVLDRPPVENKTDTYGAIGFALVLLFWAYLLGRSSRRRR